MMRTLLMTTVCMLAASATAIAAPLNPADLPREAKWVVHLDHDALSRTEAAEHIRKENSQEVEKVTHWMQKKFGVDPQNDLHGLTLFSDSYQSHSGAAILYARYDRSKVESDLKSKPAVETTSWNGHTLYTWKMDKKAWKSKHGSGKKSDDYASSPDSDSDNNQHAAKTMTAVLVDRNTIVAACSKQEVKSVVELLNGDAPSLKGADSKLTEQAPKGAILYGAAIDLNKISQHEGIFPILQQHKRIVWAIGETGSEMFEKITLVAQNEQVAGQMKNVVQGFVSFAQVWAGDAQHLAQLYEQNVEINQDGNTVHVDWHGEAQEVVAALDELKDRAEQWREARRKAQRN